MPVPPTPDELKARIEEAIAKAMEADARGDEEERERLYRQAEFYRRVLGTVEGLNAARRSGNSGDVEPNLARSLAKSPDDAFTRARLRKKLTLRGLAEAVDMSHSAIVLALKGERSIPQAKAKRIEDLIGYAATKRNWPGGIS